MYLFISKLLPNSYKFLILRKISKKYDIVFYLNSEIDELKIIKNVVFINDEKEIQNYGVIEIRKNCSLIVEKFIELLINNGYKRVEFVENEKEFSKRGYILDVYFSNEHFPIRIEFEGDLIKDIRLFDVVNQRSFKSIEKIKVILKGLKNNGKFIIIKEVLKPTRIKTIEFRNEFEKLNLEEFIKKGYKVIFATLDKDRALSLKKIYKDKVKIVKGEFKEGFIDEKRKILFVSLGFFGNLRSYKIYRSLQIGDFVVHRDYGIGKFIGIEIRGIMEYMKVQYKDGILYVPIYNLNLIKKYLGSEKPQINSLSDKEWKRTYKKASEYAKKQAYIIISKLALRKTQRGFKFKKFKEEELLKLTFPYEETIDQKRAIYETLKDMESDKVMDRLIVGDVGFGKTEIIIRASFKAVLNNKQVAILVPTTILAYQHYKNFTSRLGQFGVNIKMLSRLTPEKEVKEIKEGLRKGYVDIVIGTHKLLSKDIVFKDLGLIVIDEEHKFGVLHKEKLKNLNILTDTLYLSATPIPRTLASALKGLIDISIIRTPPKGRKEIKTIVAKYSDEIVRNAILNELLRKGQVFYVYNRIEGIYEIKNKLENMFKNAKIELIHGRMDRERIEKVFLDFYDKRIDILISTNIIDAGLDFPSANTIIVQRAEILGLSELHQLRGRVGRSNIQAYAYFLIEDDNLNENAIRRLRAIENYSYLGSGYDIALADLEIRGAGNLFGFEQSGHAYNVGFYLYLSMLEKAIYELRGMKYNEVEIEINIPAYLPKEYIQNDEIRLYFYEKITNAKTLYEIEIIEDELRDRFGELPEPAKNLINAYKLKFKYPSLKKIVITEKSVMHF
ncbi:MAG: DEAD/DEAH box helicase [candidate division WOR-3 bacterium]|jgi:transcription-repair coupling factor (superfamily II helicase)